MKSTKDGEFYVISIANMKKKLTTLRSGLDKKQNALPSTNNDSIHVQVFQLHVITNTNDKNKAAVQNWNFKCRADLV